MKNKFNKRRIVYLTLLAVLIIPLVFAVLIVGIDSYQYRRNQKLIGKIKSGGESTKTLVVFFSRSGNTELMARKIAEIKKAKLQPIQSNNGKIGVKGWIEALLDARSIEAEITPAKMDLSGYDTVYVGSPIWLYSPAPAIFEFAKNNDFKGKKVILFNSMNSKFEQKYIDQFKNIIQQQGGIFLEHLYIIRGRMTQQMQVKQFLDSTEKLFSPHPDNME